MKLLRIFLALSLIKLVIAQQYEDYSTEQNKMMIDNVDYSTTTEVDYFSFNQECNDLNYKLYDYNRKYLNAHLKLQVKTIFQFNSRV